MNDKHEEAIRALYRQSRTEHPSDFVDKRIRKAASRTLYKKSKQWVWSLSTAAVLVLSFTVVLNLVDLEPELSPALEQQELKQQQLKKNRIKSQQKKSPNYMPVIKSPPPAASMEQQSIQRVVKEEAERSQRSKRKLLSSSARQKKIDETLSFDAIQSSAMMVEDSASVKTTIPQLPQQLDQLLSLDQSLRGEKQENGLIKLYVENQLILTLLPRESEFNYQAWPGAELIGVEVDWRISAQELDACRELETETNCSLTDQVKAVYINDKLDHVLWSVNRE